MELEIIAKDESGHPYSPIYGDIYASRDGAAKQALHVFVRGNGLPERWHRRHLFSIFENGFGLGTNFLVTLNAWRTDPNRPGILHYVAVEKHPLTARQILEFADPEVRELAKELSANWPLRTSGVHRISFFNGKVVLTLFFEDVGKALKNLTGQFDAFYLDGFAPSRNPEMWQKRIFNELAKHALPDATVATWCVSSEVRKHLHDVGFEVHKEKGFGHKSQMTVGHFSPHWIHSRNPSKVPKEIPIDERSVMIVGAGLAGAALASEFRARNWQVTVIDESVIAASGASAVRWGIVHAQPAIDDNFLFRLTRAGLEALNKKTAKNPELMDLHGLVQVARSDEEFQKWKGWLESSHDVGLKDLITCVEREEASEIVGKPLLRGGIFHLNAGLLAISQWVRKRLQEPGIQLLLNQPVRSLSFRNANWQAIGSYGEVIAEAPYCILATGAETKKLFSKPIALHRWTGRISLLSGDDIESFDGAVTGPGYVIAKDNWFGVGATYENKDTGQRLSDNEAHEQNLEKLTQIFSSMQKVLASGFYEGVRAVTPDRMPYIGKVPENMDILKEGRDRLYISCGFGSRGAALADLAAQIIVGMIHGEPLPIEKDLIDAVDPKRFEE